MKINSYQVDFLRGFPESNDLLKQDRQLLVK